MKRTPKAAGPAGSSQRQLRVGELVRHALSEVLQRGDVHDPALEATVVTVPEVRMSPDLRLATAYVMPLGGRDIDAVIEALERNKKYLRGEVAHRVKNLRYAPELRFRLDTSFAEGERVDALLRSPGVRRDVAADEAAGDDGAEDGDEGAQDSK